MFSLVFKDMTVTVPAGIWNRAKIEERSKYRTPRSVDVIIRPDVRVVYLSHRRCPRKLVTLTLPGLGAVNRQEGRRTGAVLHQPRLDLGQPGLAWPTQALSYVFIFAHFKKGGRSMGSI